MINAFGIDKTTLVNIQINEIDLEHLYYLQSIGRNISINEAKDNKGFDIPLTNGSIGSFSYIKIIDNFLFLDLTIGCINNKKCRVYYTKINLTSSIANNVSNLFPLLVGDYNAKLHNLEDYFKQLYHIDLSFENSRFEEIEINRTFESNYLFEEYTPIFDTLADYMPQSRYKYKALYGECVGQPNTPTTYEFQTKKRKRTNKSAKRLKIYDKSKEQRIKKIEIADKQYIRFEYVLREEQIENNLSTNEVAKLTDEAMLSFFIDSINKDVFNTLDIADNKITIQLTKLYKEVKAEFKRGYLREFFHRASHIAYCNEQIEQIALADMKLNNNYKRNKTLLNSIVPPTNTTKKIAELKTKLLDQ